MSPAPQPRQPPEGAVDALNTLLSAGQVMFNHMLAMMAPAEREALTKRLTVEGWKARMVLEEGLCTVLLVHDHAETFQLAQFEGHDQAELN